jgi:hypothetical protein
MAQWCHCGPGGGILHLVGNHPTIMKEQRLSLLHNVGLVLITLILIAGSALLFYQLATGQGS